MSSQLNEFQNATVGMIVGVIEGMYTRWSSSVEIRFWTWGTAAMRLLSRNHVSQTAAVSF